MKYRIHYTSGFIGDPMDWYTLLYVIRGTRAVNLLHVIEKVTHATR